MKILHTSDWHLGRSLHKNKRYDEFESFLDWLYKTVLEEKIEHVLVAGDIFDNTTPSNRAQELYYKFLCRTASVSQNVVIIAGNHDSPTFLNAPKEVLKYLNIHVVGSITDDLNDEVLILNDNRNNRKSLIVCAVPFLRDRDIRKSEAGETIETKELKVIEGISNHYNSVCEIALQKQKELDVGIPIVVMGHLYTQGGKTSDGDGVRELYVGSLGHINKDIFPGYIDYVALGHLHVPQKVKDRDSIYTQTNPSFENLSPHPALNSPVEIPKTKIPPVYYSGSPIPMGFGEAGQQKKINIIEFDNGIMSIHEKLIPEFRVLRKISGNIDDIKKELLELKSTASSAWVEVEYNGDELIGDLRELLESVTEGSEINIHTIKNQRIKDPIINSIDTTETLDELTENEVFNRCLILNDIPLEQRNELTAAYDEILLHIHESDVNAE